MWDLDFSRDWLPRKRVLYAYLLGFFVPSIILAAAYVFGGGPGLTGREGFVVVDTMLFASASFIPAVFGGVVYYWVTDDVSTSLAPVAGVFSGLYSGFEDVMVYFFCSLSGEGDCAGVNGLPESLDWLFDSVFIGDVARFMGLDTVTDVSLLVSVVFGFVVGLFFVKTLDSFEENALGVNL